MCTRIKQEVSDSLKTTGAAGTMPDSKQKSESVRAAADSEDKLMRILDKQRVKPERALY